MSAGARAEWLHRSLAVRWAVALCLLLQVASCGGHAAEARRTPVGDERSYLHNRADFPSISELQSVLPGLATAMRRSVFEYFARTRDGFASEICVQFADGLGAMPDLRLHYDLRLEQYAVTETARGLDGYTSRSIGPGIVDLVRLLTSIQLVARSRSFSSSVAVRTALQAYRTVLLEAEVPAAPPTALRMRAELRARPFQHMGGQGLERSMQGSVEAEAFGPLLRELASGYVTVRRELDPTVSADSLRWKRAQGVLSVDPAAANWLAVRMEGASADDSDDDILDVWRSSIPTRRACVREVASERFFRPIVRERDASMVDAPAAELLGMEGDWDRHRPFVVRRTEGEEVQFFALRVRKEPVAVLSDPASIRSEDEFVSLARDVGALMARGHLTLSSEIAVFNRARDQEQILHEFEPRIVAISQELVGLVDDSWEAFRTIPFE